MSINSKFLTRQVHLDFHTSPDIESIGNSFSKENFQEALKIGNLESVTVFAKCHHSMCYYPTQVGMMHPHLKFDLTGAMIDAAHEIGVRAPIYITAGWSHEDAEKHPEWIARTKDGKEVTSENYEPASNVTAAKKHCAWQNLCLNDGEYAKHIYALTEEVCKRYKDVDGLFFDIVTGDACYCEECKSGMAKMGFDIENDSDARQYFIIKRKAFMQKCTDILKKYHPNATIFFNGDGANQYKSWYHDFQTHFEMEDLPTAWGGYNKLPMRAKYFSNKNKSVLGMTGKFHLDWGEFGGFKPKEALKFELAVMALYGVGASIGDHMHPDGKMEIGTYENIGYAYNYMEKIAPFCYGGQSCANIGVYLSDDFEANEGLSNILLENQIDFDIISGCDFEKYDTVIFLEGTRLKCEELAALKAYIENDGKVILMGDAIVENGNFQLDFGVKYIGGPEFDCDYIVLSGKSPKFPDAPLLCDVAGHRTYSTDAEVFAEFITPYFSRTYEHFCGHKNTPYDKSSRRYPAIAKSGNIVYISHSLSKQYYRFGSIFHKRYFMMALNLVYGGAVLQVDGLYSQGRCRIIFQPDEKRYCINMVYVAPVKRGMAEIIEDIVPIYDIKVRVKTIKQIKRIYMPLDGDELPFFQNSEGISFVVPKLSCHASVVLEY